MAAAVEPSVSVRVTLSESLVSVNVTPAGVTVSEAGASVPGMATAISVTVTADGTKTMGRHSVPSLMALSKVSSFSVKERPVSSEVGRTASSPTRSNVE